MQREEAIDLILASPLAEYGEALTDYLLPSARIFVSDLIAEGGDSGAATYFGGKPSLPENSAWPDWDKTARLEAEIPKLEDRLRKLAEKTYDRPEAFPGFRERRLAGMRQNIEEKRKELSHGRTPLAFLGQMSLSEIHAVAPQAGWPRKGVLAFFYDAEQIWGYDPLDRGHCRVVYCPDEDGLVELEFPESLAANARFPKHSLRLQSEWTLPQFIDQHARSLPPLDWDEYCELTAKLNGDSKAGGEPIHRVGGHPQEVQGEMRLECQLVTQGLYCGDKSGYEDPRAAELKSGVADWRLLAQIDSDENSLGWMWGDLGRVYFWARQQDIEACSFTNCWAILQCG